MTAPNDEELNNLYKVGQAKRVDGQTVYVHKDGLRAVYERGLADGKAQAKTTTKKKTVTPE